MKSLYFIFKFFDILGGIADIPTKLSGICQTLCKAIESIEYLIIAGMEQEDGFRYRITSLIYHLEFMY